MQNINKYIKSLDTPYHFKTDDGSFETAIEFIYADQMYTSHPPLSKNWDSNPVIKCPDLLAYDQKKIIEYEEEPKPGKRMGKLGKKGHSSESTRDSERDELYHRAGFQLHKVWESEYKDGTWKEKLYKFLKE